MSHPPKVAALIALTEGALSPEGARRLEAHLGSCEPCREVRATIEQYQATAQAVRASAPPDLDWTRMEAALERASHDAVSATRQRAPGARRIAVRMGFGVAALAAAAALVVTGPGWQRSTGGAARQHAPAPSDPGHDVTAGPGRTGGIQAARRVSRAEVTLAAGHVTRIEGGRLAEAIVGDRLSDGTALQTDEGSWVHARISSDEAPSIASGVALAPGGRMAVESLEATTVLSLVSGTLHVESSFSSDSRLVILAAEHRFEAQVARFELRLDPEGRLDVTVHDGQVRATGPAGDSQSLDGPVAWSSRPAPPRSPERAVGASVERGPSPEATGPAPSTRVHGLDLPEGAVLSLARAAIVRWDVDGMVVDGSDRMALRVRPGTHTAVGMDAAGRAFRAVLVVGQDGLSVAGDAFEPAAPRLRVGVLAQIDIERVVLRGLPRLRACYEHALVERPDLGGRVTARVTVGIDGHVARARLLDDAAPEDVRTCVTSIVGTWEFPLPVGGPVTFDVPLSFASR